MSRIVCPHCWGTGLEPSAATMSCESCTECYGKGHIWVLTPL